MPKQDTGFPYFNRKNLSPHLLAISVFIFVSMCSVYLSEKTKGKLLAKSAIELQIQGEQIRDQVQNSVDFATNSLRALTAFYDTNGTVAQESFNSFTQALIDASHNHIQALEWIPRIEHQQRHDFVAQQKKHSPEFNITERNSDGNLVNSSDKSRYYPVTYIMPFEKNRAAHGFDLNSNSARRAALEIARDSGQMISTAKIRLVQETQNSFGFLTFAPIYNRDFPLDKASQRAQALRGFVLGVFRIDSLMKSANERAQQDNLTLTLFDQHGGQRDRLYGEQAEFEGQALELTIQQRHWQLIVTPNKKLHAKINSPSLARATLIAGLFISVLLAILSFALLRISASAHYSKKLNRKIQLQNSQLEAIVAARTADLAKKNQTLEINLIELTANRNILISLIEDVKTEKDIAEQRSVELEKSNHDLDEFAFTASHDLKSPLRAIDHLSTWIKEDLEAGNLQEIPNHIGLMQQRIKRLETLLDDLLSYSRAGRIEEKISTIDCNILVRDAFLIISAPATFKFKIIGDLPVFTTLIAPFEQVMRNLIGNAVKHHDREDGEVQISHIELAEHYEFSIKDDGPGIDASHHEQIFNMFHALKSRDDVEGSGMGLALVKKVTEHYGGDVSLESSPGKGSTFYITWPKNI